MKAFQASDWVAACAISALALGVRLLGIRFGLPFFHHWDEGWVTDNASHMLQTADWRPRIYQYGAPLSMLMGLTLRAMSDLWPKRVIDPGDWVLMHLIGRVVTALISASGAFATYVAARYALVGDRGARTRAAYAALLYATAAELVSHGRYAVTDANLVALVAWSLAFGALYVRGGRARFAAATIGFAALAAAFKVTAAMAVAIPLTLFLARRARKAFLITVPASAVVFFVLNPHVLLHWNAAWGDILVRINQYREGRVPEFLVRRAGLEHFFAILDALAFQVFHRTPMVSAVTSTLAFYGLWRAIRARSLVCIAGLAHVSLVFVAIAMTRAFLVRNYLIALPVCCIGFGFTMEAIHARLLRRSPQIAVASVFAVFFLVVPIAQAVENERESADTRTRAMDWISAHITGANATVACTPQIGVDSTGFRKDALATLQRPNLTMTDTVATAAQVEFARPDFVLVVSSPDYFGRGDTWPFIRVRGYDEIADFDANPYEHNFEITPTWNGRFNVKVLERHR